MPNKPRKRPKVKVHPEWQVYQMANSGRDASATSIIVFKQTNIAEEDWRGPVVFRYSWNRSFELVKDEGLVTWDEEAAEAMVTRLTGYPPANLAWIDRGSDQEKEAVLFKHLFMDHPTILEALMAARSSGTGAIVCRRVDDPAFETHVSPYRKATPRALLQANLMMSRIGYDTGLVRLRLDPKMARRKLHNLKTPVIQF
jgi:hypothetical protein